MNLPHPLKVLHAYKLYYPHEGGIQTIMQLLASGLQHRCQSDILVSVPAGLGSNDLSGESCIYRTSSCGTLLSLPIAPTYPLHFWRLASRVNIVDYHFPMPLVDLAVSLYFPRNTRLIIHWHSDIVAQQRTAKIIAPLIHRCLKRANRIIVASPELIRYSHWLQPYQEKCTVVPFGIDISLWNQLSETEQQQVVELRQKYPQLILAVGRLVPYKGFSVLIEAMRQVEGQLIIVGRGPEEQKLKTMIETYGLANRVILLGRAQRNYLKCLYHAAKIFVLPSISANEAFGMVQLEAMAAHKPIINTSLHSGVPWVARDQQEAITVPPHQIEPLQQAINLLLSQPGFAQNLADNAYRRVEAEFTLPLFLEKTYQVYEEVASN